MFELYASLFLIQVQSEEMAMKIKNKEIFL